MNLTNSLKLFLIILIAFSLSSCEDEEERQVTEKEVLKAVLQAFNSAYPGAIFIEYAEEKEDGKKFYEATTFYALVCKKCHLVLDIILFDIN